MSNPIQSAKDQLCTLLEQAYHQAAAEGLFVDELPCPITVEEPKDREHGDLASNFCMQAVRVLHQNPRAIAAALCKHVDLTGSFFQSVEIAGPGFLNVRFSPAFYQSTLSQILNNQENYGRLEIGSGKKVMVEFVSANPTGPMHIGNARGGAVGDSLAAVLQWAGYEVTREFYVNDAGNQIEKFFRSLDARYVQATQGENACEFPEDGYQGEDIKDRVREYLAQYGDDLSDTDEQTRKEKLVGFALERNITGLEHDLSLYRIHYDVWFRESSLYRSGEVEQTLNLLKQNGYTYEQDGALWFAATRFGCEKDEVLVRANGLCTYFAADIAYHRNKFQTRGFDRVINIWGADHHGHIARLKGALDALGLDGSKLDVVLVQLVRLMRGNELVKVSKRSGKALALRDLLDEIPVDAARFFFNLRQCDSHFDFDLDLAVEQSAQNPVYYVQYAHARICSILRLLEQQGYPLPKSAELDAALLATTEEQQLLSHLAAFPDTICKAAQDYAPFYLTRHSIETAALFHKFYNACRVNCEDEALKAARVGLVLGVQQVLRNALSILAVEAPESM